MYALDALPDPLLIVRDAQPMADSRIVARMFATKPHRNVLVDIRQLLTRKPELEQEFLLLIDEYKAGKGASRKTPYYLMTEAGFMMLVMRFTGEAALTVQLKFVQAFKEMRSILNAQRESFAERMRDWELRERESKARGSVGGRALNTRKREIPALEAEHGDILRAVQLTLKLT